MTGFVSSILHEARPSLSQESSDRFRFVFHPQEAAVERKCLLIIALAVLTTFVGCTTVYKLNPLSRSHGLPTQYERDGE